MLSARGLRVARGRRVVLDDYDVDVAAGEIVHLVGPNGAGKTSLLRVLAGVVEPRRGVVRRAGGCAFVAERVALPERLSAQRWLEVCARVRGRDAVAKRDGLPERCGQLSKGQAQLLSLDEALDGTLGVVILDEPWSGLDPGARHALNRRVVATAQRGAAVLVTDHSASADVVATRTLALGSMPRAQARVTLTRAGDHEVVEVEIAQRDALLAARLADGWGIERVERA